MAAGCIAVIAAGVTVTVIWNRWVILAALTELKTKRRRK